MKILSIVGARPEFVQAAPVCKALRGSHQEILAHTGQHYDYKMSQAFFNELGLPEPTYNLEVGSGSHAQQTADIMNRLEQVLLRENPDLVIIRGDTNSTLAGALTASKLHIPIAHIEAGERSYDRRMPEEINRLVADQLADIHLCASQIAVQRLANEGISGHVHWVGDVMLDALLQNREIALKKSDVLAQLKVEPKQYALVTIHRAVNTDNPFRLKQIILALTSVRETIIFPVHPRTRKVWNSLDISVEGSNVRLVEPVSYFDMIVLEENARLVATDSGGVQREAYCLNVPCLTLRDETEWTQTVEAGWNKLVGAEPEMIVKMWHSFSPPAKHPAIFGDGSAAKHIVQVLENTMAGLSKPEIICQIDRTDVSGMKVVI